MRIALHMALVLFGCIQAACAPVFLGRVLCSTASGHYAMEPMHTAVAPCGATGESAPHEDSPWEPCKDIQLGCSQFATEANRADLSPTAPAPLWTAGPDGSFAPAFHLASEAIHIDPSIAHLPDAERLSTVILII